MNINQLINSILNMATGFPVAQDEYGGEEDKYILYTYFDEKPQSFGDNRPTADVAYIHIQLITPKNYNYFAKKEAIRNALEDSGFIVTSISSMLGDAYQGTQKTRQTIFEAQYASSR